MIVKNSLSIATSNFSLIFKIMAFSMVLVLLFAAVFTGILSPIISELGKALDVEINFQTDQLPHPDGMSAGGSIGGLFQQLWGSARAFFAANKSAIWFAFGMLLLTLFSVRFFLGIILLPVGKYLGNKMTTGYSAGLYRTFITTAGTSIALSFFSSLLFLIFDIGLSVLVVYLCFLLFPAIGVFAIYIGIIAIIVLISLRTALTGMWLPRIAIGGEKPLVALRNALRDTKKTFQKTLAGSLAIWIFIALFAAATVPFTLGLSFVIMIPMGAVMYISTSLVQYCHFYGQNYFKDEKTVVKVTEESKEASEESAE